MSFALRRIGHHLGFAICRASRDDYENSFLPNGLRAGTPAEVLDCACDLKWTVRMDAPGEVRGRLVIAAPWKACVEPTRRLAGQSLVSSL